MMSSVDYFQTGSVERQSRCAEAVFIAVGRKHADKIAGKFSCVSLLNCCPLQICKSYHNCPWPNVYRKSFLQVACMFLVTCDFDSEIFTVAETVCWQVNRRKVARLFFDWLKFDGNLGLLCITIWHICNRYMDHIDIAFWFGLVCEQEHLPIVELDSFSGFCK